MVTEIESLGQWMIARRAGGGPVEVMRSPDEMVFLAFDASIKRLVELHVLKSGRMLDEGSRRSAVDRARQVSEIRGPSFMHIQDVGEDRGQVYYTSNLNGGEFIGAYIGRRGALQPAMVFCLVFQLLDDLLQLKKYQHLVPQMRLDRVVMTTLEDTFLQLRIYDYGLSSMEGGTTTGANQVIQVCELMFLMLTGKGYAGDNLDRYPSLKSLPMSLRTMMRIALTDPSQCPASIVLIRDSIREALGALGSGMNVRNPRKQLVMIPALQPRSQLQDLLLEDVPVETILGNRFRMEGDEDVRRSPFSIPCLNAKNGQPVTVHLLPPSRIVDKAQYEAVPLQAWRFNATEHPNLLRSLSLWESPGWSFLAEEREPGFALSRLLAERITLNPQEVSVLLRQVHAGLEQALECGVQRLDLHPSNIVLRVGRNGQMLSREHDRLMQKRLDAWPVFQVKLRAHLTMRNLYEPPLVDRPDQGAHLKTHLADADCRACDFIALAAYLLTGQRQGRATSKFPEATPEMLSGFMRECLEKSRDHGQVPSPADFLDQFEGLMSATPAGPDLATRLRGTSASLEEMESVGSVSDFDNEWADAADTEMGDNPIPAMSRARKFKPTDFSRKKSIGGLNRQVWAAAAAVILALAGWRLFYPGQGAVSPAEISPEVALMEQKVAEPVSVPSADKAAENPEAPPSAIPKKPPEVTSALPLEAVPVEKPSSSPVSVPVKNLEASSDAVVAVPPVAPAQLAEPLPEPLPVTPTQPVPNPVIIRKAIVPSQDEIAQFKQGLAEPLLVPSPAEGQRKSSEGQRSGAVPAIHVAQPSVANPATRQ